VAVQRPRRAGDVGGFQRGVEVIVDDLEGAGVGVADANLLGRELVLDQLVFDPFLRKRAGRVDRHHARDQATHIVLDREGDGQTQGCGEGDDVLEGGLDQERYDDDDSADPDRANRRAAS
jgi:hypothetical protein